MFCIVKDIELLSVYFNNRRDGRSWLPLHWAAALHNTDEEDMATIIKERPASAMQGHLSSDGVKVNDGNLNLYCLNCFRSFKVFL
jgi:hypothetical protein